MYPSHCCCSLDAAQGGRYQVYCTEGGTGIVTAAASAATAVAVRL